MFIDECQYAFACYGTSSGDNIPHFVVWLNFSQLGPILVALLAAILDPKLLL